MAKTFVGVVTSDKADKTIVVTVVTRKTHPIYRKKYISSKKFMAHDEKNEAKSGDKVSIVETRPISANKHFRLEKIIEKPVLRGGLAGDVEVPAPEKKEIVKKDKPAVATETKAKKATKKSENIDESTEAKGDDK